MEIPQDILSKLARLSIEVGNIYRIRMDESNGITPKKPGDTYRDKYFVVLGFDSEGNVYGGIVINSQINRHLPPPIAALQIPILRIHYSFLDHDSYLDCASLKAVSPEKFRQWKYLGKLRDIDQTIVFDSVKNSPSISKADLKRFGIL